MALIDCEGFGFSSAFQDFTTYAGWALNAGSYSNEAIVSGGPFSDSAVQVQSSHSIGKTLPSANATSLIVGVAFKTPSSSADYGALVFADSANASQTYITLKESAGQIIVTSGGSNFAADANMSGGTVLGSTGAVFSGSTWTYLEVEIVIAASGGGSVKCYINGGLVLSLSGVTTQGTANTGANAIGFKGPQNGNASYNNYADIYVCDTTGGAPWNAPLGVTQVLPLNPTANDAVQFTPNGLANNYQNAAKYPPVPATDFNQTTTVGNQDTFTHGSASSLTSIAGVAVKSLLLNPLVNGETMANRLLSSTSAAQGATRTPGTAGLLYTDVFETDPATSAAWTVAAAGSSRNGYKLLT